MYNAKTDDHVLCFTDGCKAQNHAAQVVRTEGYALPYTQGASQTQASLGGSAVPLVDYFSAAGHDNYMTNTQPGAQQSVPILPTEHAR